MKNLKMEGVECNVGGCPTIDDEKYFKNNFRINKNNFPNTEYLKDKTISFIVDQTVDKKEIRKVCDILLFQINKLAMKK